MEVVPLILEAIQIVNAVRLLFCVKGVTTNKEWFFNVLLIEKFILPLSTGGQRSGAATEQH